MQVRRVLLRIHGLALTSSLHLLLMCTNEEARIAACMRCVVVAVCMCYFPEELPFQRKFQITSIHSVLMHGNRQHFGW